ncbi:MAG: geranylgeranyl reductase family protein [Micrococcales bacterium]|nr:geranylgeranyl reductase family protein [Micrococcales bacterium]
MTDTPSEAAPPAQRESADVIVVGAGPAGSATAAYLARSGLDVLLLEKARFPRDKICGDGLTPRAVKELATLGVATREEDGWHRNHGLRIIGGGMRLSLPWPEVSDFPGYGMAKARMDLDETLARHAAASGAQLREGVSVTGAVRDGAGRITGVTAKLVDERGRATGERTELRAPVVVACDGVSSRIAVSMGREKREDRPMGVAVRTYYETPRHDDDYMESWLELWTRDESGRRIQMPGYGWLFPLGNGLSNVGLGMLDTSPAFGNTDYKDVMRRWVAEMPGEWQISDETMQAPIRGAALPMSFNRQPLYADGLLLVGDAGGMVNPFNGEGIDYALQSGRIAADIVARALATGDAAARERTLQSYTTVMKDDLGGYFTLGRIFAQLIGHPEVMRLATKYGLPRTTLMKFLLKLMANLSEPRGGGLDDRVISLLARMAPDA